MDAPSLLRIAFRDFHRELVEDVSDLGHDVVFWQPGEGVNHIGFLLWHIVRDEDAVIAQSVLKGPELCTPERAAKLGLDTTAQGTGFEPAELANFRYDVGELVSYAWDVWAQTDEALAALDPARLDEDLGWNDSWKLVNLLTTGCLAHGWMHLGEIRQLLGLRGWRFRE